MRTSRSVILTASLTLLLALTCACTHPAKMAEPVPGVRAVTRPLPSGGEAAIVAPIAFAAADFSACIVVPGESCDAARALLYTAFIVRSGDHTFLIDAGAGADYRDWMERLPMLRGKAFTFEIHETITQALARFGVRPEDLDGIVLTHGGVMTLSGVPELPNVPIIAAEAELSWLTASRDVEAEVARDLMALSKAGARGVAFDGPAVATFPASHDLFGDGRVLLVPLPGPTPGTLGVILPNVGGSPVLFLGDLVWRTMLLDPPTQKPRFLAKRMDEDRDALSQSLYRVEAYKAADPGLMIVPSRDPEAFDALKDLSDPWIRSP